MLAVNYTTLRENLKSYCDKATDEGETIIVTRKNEKNVVIISLEEWSKLQHTIRNADYLSKIDRSAVAIKEGRIVTKTIDELEDMANE